MPPGAGGAETALMLSGGVPPPMAGAVPGAPFAMMPGPPGFYNPYQNAALMGAMYPQPYGQMMPQMMGPQMMGQMGYPKMNPDGSFSGVAQPYATAGYAPGMLPPGYKEEKDKKRLWEHFSYLDDIARCHGWILSQLARVFHERNRALKICIPSSAFAVFFVIVSTMMVLDVTSGEVDAALRQCRVQATHAEQVREGNMARRFRPTVHVNIHGRSGEHALTRFRNADDFEVETEEEAWQYLSKFSIGSDIPCYEFDDGAFQLDEAEYTSPWLYIIMTILLMSAAVCCCIWVASGTFACCSPLITVTVQA